MILLYIRAVPSYPTPVSNLPILTQSAQPTRATLYVYRVALPIPLTDERANRIRGTSWHAFVIPWVVAHAFAVIPAVSVALRQLLQAALGDGSLSSHFSSRKPIFSPIGLAHFFSHNGLHHHQPTS
jgi:hypothetical protein